MIDCEPVIEFKQKMNESNHLLGFVTFEEMKRRGMSRTEKKRNYFDVTLCEKALLLSLKRHDRDLF